MEPRHSTAIGALTVDALSKTYRRASTPANQDICLEFRPGELTALIGHNGAGKTTLLNQMIGVTRPDAGTIRYAGRSLTREPQVARRVCAMMPQLHAPLQGVTPTQAVSAIARLRGHSAPATKRATAELLAELDIVQWAGVPGEKLSGGLRRITSYAMAVVCPPPVLLIDEPTNDVDPVRRNLIWKSLRTLADSGHVVIVVTHNLLEVERSADRFVLLQQGSVREEGDPRRLSTHAGDMVLTLATAPGRDPTGVTDPAVTHLRMVLDDSGRQARLYLTAAQVPDAVSWAQTLADTGVIDSYTLGPVSLDTLYEGMTNVA